MGGENREREKISKGDLKLREGSISIVLDSYEGLFSDFDPRPYSLRSLSDDFLLECKKASVVNENPIELRFLIPKNKRIFSDETRIKKRLKEYFHKQFKEKDKEIKKIKINGFLWFLAGAMVMAISPLFLNSEMYLIKVLSIMSEPAAWFFFWEGLGKIFILSKSETKDYTFYKKMSGTNISFFDY